MDRNSLIGMRVRETKSHAIGTIIEITDNVIVIDFHGVIRKYSFPSALSTVLELEDEKMQCETAVEAREADFESFKNLYVKALSTEIQFIKSGGGKKYKAIDGERLDTGKNDYMYAFDTDSDYHFPDGTVIKIYREDTIVVGYVIACEDFTLLIRTSEFIGERVDVIEFSADLTQLLEAQIERLQEMDPERNQLAYEIACRGKGLISEFEKIRCGQSYAFNRATSEKITFIWGPPGTGKTETLANIAIEHLQNGRRVLMLSYSNVSVDGALLRVASKADMAPGRIIRYGYPRSKELLESKTLTSYQFVLNKNPSLAEEYQALVEEKRKLKKKDERRIELSKRISKIRELLDEAEKNLIQKVSFLATTISKAVIDKAVYCQDFDVVIFDEASMAYVPQIVYAAGMAKKHFVCLGDFCQLSAIVQSPGNERLERDIFDYVGITSAVENNLGHEWLVMLNIQYRMHEEIADFVGKYMYAGLLETAERIMEGRREIATCQPMPEEAMMLADLSGTYSVCIKTMDGSRINLLSALVCMRLAESYLNKFEVGIITPYSAQSKLITAMIRDMQEKDNRWDMVSCATVHQFQGSEKPIIIYDAVDCYRMAYPGVLLTAQKNKVSDRLFNVAMTRAKGKFILVANWDYLQKKKISDNLLFGKALKKMKRQNLFLQGDALWDELENKNSQSEVILSDMWNGWADFLLDIKNAKKEILIDLPGFIEDNDEALKRLVEILDERVANEVKVVIRTEEGMTFPEGIMKYVQEAKFVTTPAVTIDKSVLWFGQPLSVADFLSEGAWMETTNFPCVRLVGEHAVKSVQMQIQS